MDIDCDLKRSRFIGHRKDDNFGIGNLNGENGREILKWMELNIVNGVSASRTLYSLIRYKFLLKNIFPY